MNNSPDSPPSHPADLVELGRIVSAYGIRGWVKVQPHAAGSQALLQAGTWWLTPPGLPAVPGGPTPPGQPAMPVKVAVARTQGSTVVGQLQGVPDRNAAELLKGYTVGVPREAFPDPDDDEYYWVDLIGCLLYGEDDNRQQALIGRVTQVNDNGAHAVLTVQRLQPAGSAEPRPGQAPGLPESTLLEPVLSDKGKPVETLVPFVKAHVHTVDLPNKCLFSNWPLTD
jgi:16S rRNA processing protein RimM